MGFSLDIVGPLVNAGQTWYNAAWARIKEIWDKGTGWVILFWGACVTACGWLYTVWHMANGHLGEAIGKLDSVATPSLGLAPGSISNIFATANTFMPLQEIFTMMTTYAALLTALFAFKVLRKALGWLIGI